MNLLKKILKYPVVLAFFLFIFLFTAVDLVKPDREYSEFENKYLTQRPEFTLASFLNNEWTSKYETYLNDQFVLRDDWITLKSICESMLLKIENNGIAYGRMTICLKNSRRWPGTVWRSSNAMSAMKRPSSTPMGRRCPSPLPLFPTPI